MAFARAQIVLDVPRVVELEHAIAAAGTPLATLMQRAGEAISRETIHRVAAPASIVVLAGSGNNGGDGWVAAEALAKAGYSVSLITPCPASDLHAEPARTTASTSKAPCDRDRFRSRLSNHLPTTNCPIYASTQT